MRASVGIARLSLTFSLSVSVWSKSFRIARAYFLLDLVSNRFDDLNYCYTLATRYLLTTCCYPIFDIRYLLHKTCHPAVVTIILCQAQPQLQLQLWLRTLHLTSPTSPPQPPAHSPQKVGKQVGPTPESNSIFKCILGPNRLLVKKNVGSKKI